MRVAFYMDNSRYNTVDMSKPEEGNPGIGGTQFLQLTTAYYLQKNCNDIEVFLLAPIITFLPKELKNHQCISQKEAVLFSSENRIDILILRNNMYDIELYDLIDKVKQKVICWSHNHENNSINSLIHRTSYVKRQVCVSREQLDTLLDHPVFSKSTYIFNGIDFGTLHTQIPQHRKPIVGYIGSITPEKGVYELLEIWPNVIKKKKDAILYIVGSENLYNKENPQRLHTKYFEKCIQKIEQKNIGSSIVFCGVATKAKKDEFLNEISVGVASGKGKDTFCLSAIECEYFYIPIVSKNKGGVLNSAVKNKSAFFFNSKRQFYKGIIKLLSDENLAKSFGEFGHEYVKDKFDINSIVNEWYRLLYDVYNNIPNCPEYRTSNYLTNLKWLREINRRIKKVIPFLPSLLWYEEQIKTFGKKILRRSA